MSDPYVSPKGDDEVASDVELELRRYDRVVRWSGVAFLASVLLGGVLRVVALMQAFRTLKEEGVRPEELGGEISSALNTALWTWGLALVALVVLVVAAVKRRGVRRRAGGV